MNIKHNTEGIAVLPASLVDFFMIGIDYGLTPGWVIALLIACEESGVTPATPIEWLNLFLSLKRKAESLCQSTGTLKGLASSAGNRTDCCTQEATTITTLRLERSI